TVTGQDIVALAAFHAQKTLAESQNGKRRGVVTADLSTGHINKPADGAFGWAGADYGVWSKGLLEAIDYQTGKIRWSHDLGGGSGAGVLTTASGLLFTGDAQGSVLALRTSDGNTL